MLQSFKIKRHIKLILIYVCIFFDVAQSQVPGVPTNLLVTPINTGGEIQFNAPSSSGGSAITNYEYSTDNGATWVTPSPAVTASPLVISSGLTNCTSYQVKIRAVNASGSGTASASATLIPLMSRDDRGTTWVLRTASVANNWRCVTYGNGLFVAVGAGPGSGNRVMTSPDGINWTSRTSAADFTWSSVTYGNGLFVAVAQIGLNNTNVMTSPDGITWTLGSLTSTTWHSVTFGNGRFVAVAESGAVVTSDNGTTWSSRTPPSSIISPVWNSVTYGNGRFVAVARSASSSGNLVMTSLDGITWTAGNTTGFDNNWRNVTYGNGRFVAVARSGIGNRVMTSENGTTWTSRTSASNNEWFSVNYGNGIFVAVGNNSGSGDDLKRVMTSLDGITWTAQTSAAQDSWQSVTYANGIFVAVSNGTGSNRVMTSSFSFAANSPVITSATLGSTTTINFTQSSSAYATAISNYQYSINSGSSWTALSPAASTSPLTINGLSGGTNSIMTRAVNSVGNSCPSNNYLFTSLPVSLSSFTIKPTPNYNVSLGWITSSESTNKGFRIERQAGSVNGKFEQIGFVGSKANDGNSQNTLAYSFIDAKPAIGIVSFYRLVQEDLDGKLTYSEVRMVKLNAESVSMVFPNPSNGLVNISRTADGKKINIQVTDQYGKIIFKARNITETNYTINIPQSGLYTIKMIYPQTGKQAMQRVVIQK